MTDVRPQLRSQRLRLINHQGDALRLGMNRTEEDLGKPQVLVDSARDRQGLCHERVARRASEGASIT